MSVRMVIELPDAGGAQTVVHALDSYKARLRASIERSRRRLDEFEQQYGTTTAAFLTQMAAEDLSGGDLDYVAWTGEAKLLQGLEAELDELEHARVQLP